MPPRSQIYPYPPHWRPDCRTNKRNIPPDMISWLFEQGSLTRRLQGLCGSSFNLRLISQSWSPPFHEESQRLNLRSSQRAIIREVALCSGATPLVLARSVIPARTLRGSGRRLGKLGTRPLGQILFAHPRLERPSLEFATISCPGHPKIWGRRSLYSLGAQHTLLVAEVFTPELFALISDKMPWLH